MAVLNANTVKDGFTIKRNSAEEKLLKKLGAYFLVKTFEYKITAGCKSLVRIMRKTLPNSLHILQKNLDRLLMMLIKKRLL